MGSTTPPCSTPRLIVSLLAAAFACNLPVWAASNKPAGCLIEPEQVADVGSPVTGVIEGMQAALGDQVEAGQPLVRLRADVERANAGVAVVRAQVDAEVKAAQANWDLARQKVRRNQQLLEQSFVSTQAVEQAVAESEVAEQKLKLAQSQQKIYAREEAVAIAQVGLRTLRSPIKGVVIERYSNLGERVEDKPVMRIAAIDPLRVSLMVPIAQYGQLAVGNSLLIRPEMPGIEPVRATVTYVDKVVDAASNSFRVRLTLPNPGNRLPGGLRCKADMVAQAAPAAPSKAPAGTPALPATPPAMSLAPAAPKALSAPPAQVAIAASAASAKPAPALMPPAAITPAPAVPLIDTTPVAAAPAVARVAPGMSPSMHMLAPHTVARMAPTFAPATPVTLKSTMALSGQKPVAVATAPTAAPAPAPAASANATPSSPLTVAQAPVVHKPRRKPVAIKAPPTERSTDITEASFGDNESSPQLNTTLTLIIER